MSAPIHPDAFNRIRLWLNERSGMHYPEHKHPILMQRLERVLRETKMRDLDALAKAIDMHDDPLLESRIINSAATNHTYFYREPEVLEHFVSMVLADWQTRPKLRLWSAACSSGEEVYTLAMMLAEALGRNALNRVSILGTDISSEVIAEAEAGLYHQRQVASLPSGMLDRYFQPSGPAHWQVARWLQAPCTFRRLNLIQGPYPMTLAFQAVFLRNVLYYFERADQIRVLDAVWAVTEPGGWLVTSVTEPVRDLTPGWEHMAPGLYRRRG